MIPELGHYALVLALALSLVQVVFPLVGARTGDARLLAVAPAAAMSVFLCVAFSFYALTAGYVTSDFSIRNVWENSHSLKPMLYKITGVWGNHEGSMLLWVLILVFFGALVAAFGANLPLRLKALVIAVQGMISIAFLLFILLTSNPFTRLDPAPFEGNDLNPILQDIGLAIHPPLLYLGYVGFSVCFSFAAPAGTDGATGAAGARWVRRWTLAAGMFLTAGIAMGSYWAYYELGWGGWWFWDPVENASFMPWLSGTALLHSAIVMEKRSALKVWTILLAILTFSLSLLGTFLVRSGVLTSVHSFASDPTRGVFILMILIAFIGGSLVLFGVRAPNLKTGGLFAPISREGALVLNNLFLTVATATVLVGTLYPLLLEALTGEKISVGPPYFDLTFGPLMVPLLIAVPFGTLLPWKRGDLYAAAQRLWLALGVAIIAGLVTLWIETGAPVLAAFGIALGAWLVVGAFADLWQKASFRRVGISTGLSRLVGLPRSVFGSAIAHAGLGVSVLGIVAATAFQTETVKTMAPGDVVPVAGYELRFEGLQPRKGPNYTEDVGRFALLDRGVKVAEMESAKRVYTARRMPTTEAGIETRFLNQVYVALGDPVEGQNAIVVRVWWKPLVTLIWFGCVVMVIGGIASLSDRRLRIGAPQPSRPRGVAPAE